MRSEFHFECAPRRMTELSFESEKMYQNPFSDVRFDPASGAYLAGGTFRASALGTWFAGARPDDTDLVLLIRKQA